MCQSECQVGCGPSTASARVNKGSGGTRQSHANKSSIGTFRACRSNRLPIAKLTGEINSTAKAPTLKSKPTVPQIIKQADRGDADSGHLQTCGNLAKRHRSKCHREQRLALHDHAGKTDGHIVRNGPGLRQKLSEKQRAADRYQHRPGNIRPAHEQARHGRNRKAHRRHQRGREFVRAPACWPRTRDPR